MLSKCGCWWAWWKRRDGAAEFAGARWGASRAHLAGGGSDGSCGQFHASVNTKNQLLDPINNSYQYDAAGNVIFDGSHHYLYDAENRLIQVDPHSGYCSSQGNTSTAAACYVYDALGRRVAKIPASGVWTQYAYDLSGNVISEYGEGCGPTCWARGYVYFNGQRIAEYANSTTYFAHNDHLGSPRLFTDVTAAYTTDCYDFLPFGERNLPTSPCSSPSPPAPPPVNTSHLFTGKERDAESGLDDFDARYYSSGMGRFMSPDWSDVPAPVPYADLTNPQTLNLYAYVKNNPLRDTDPTGHSGDDDIVDHILNFVVSAGVTFISDNLFGAGRPQPKSVEGQLGQAVGDFAAQQSGIAEAEAGTAGLTDSGVMALVPGGQEVAAGDALVSGAAILHGSATATIATVNLAKSATAPGSRPGQDFTPAGKREIDARDANKCQNCGRDVKSQQNKPGQSTPADQRQRHHIKPKKEGGSGTPENGTTLCPGCHKEKHRKPKEIPGS